MKTALPRNLTTTRQTSNKMQTIVWITMKTIQTAKTTKIKLFIGRKTRKRLGLTREWTKIEACWVQSKTKMRSTGWKLIKQKRKKSISTWIQRCPSICSPCRIRSLSTSQSPSTNTTVSSSKNTSSVRCWLTTESSTFAFGSSLTQKAQRTFANQVICEPVLTNLNSIQTIPIIDLSIWPTLPSKNTRKTSELTKTETFSILSNSSNMCIRHGPKRSFVFSPI